MLIIPPPTNLCQVFYVKFVLHFRSGFYLFYQSFCENRFENNEFTITS